MAPAMSISALYIEWKDGSCPQSLQTTTKEGGGKGCWDRRAKTSAYEAVTMVKLPNDQQTKLQQVN